MTTHVAVAPTARGARRRALILDAAVQLFADVGYRSTSMRDIAAEAGISHPGLLRHYSSKSEMLMEIVQRMEDDNYRWYASPDKQRDQTAAVQLAERNTQRHGYLAVFTALAGEATSPQHPAHAYMRDHYAKMREFDFSDFPSGAPLGEGRRPADEAVRFIAAWDGLQLLELYAPQSINTAEELSAHTTMILSPFGSRGPEPRDRSGHRALVSPSDLNAVTPLQGNTVGRARREQIVEIGRAHV